MLLLVLACPTTPADSRQPQDPRGDSGEPADVPPGDSEPADSGDPDTGADDPRCPSLDPADYDANGVLTQDWSNGEYNTTLRKYKNYDWTGADGKTYNIWTEPGWESSRFEFADPTCIYAVEVFYGILPDGGGDIPFGLYADFGWNGFDFHPDQPYWTDSAALESDDEETWVSYTLAHPLYIEGPALVYGASWRDGENGPALGMDSDYAGDGGCGQWDECHSQLNYPDADKSSYYNGTTFPWAYDFLIRVKYRTLETIAEEDLWFHADPALTGSSNVSWGDYDDDGDADLMTNGPTLYRNDGGTFVNVTDESGVAASGIGTSGGVWGDYDNDGCLDYFGLGGGYTAGDLLLHSNCDGTFSDATAESGISDWQDEKSCLGSGDPEYSPTAGATWTDFDNDGLLDLVQANFLCFDTYTYYPDRFWHNLGDGTFERWGEEHGFDDDNYAGRGAETVDIDGDGDLDVMIVDYVLQRNMAWVNNGDGTFSDLAKDNGLSGNSTRVGAQSYYGHSIGLKWGDLDNDLDWDVVVGNLAHPRFYDFSDKTNLLLNEGGVWIDRAAENGIAYHETHSNPSLLDIENDGDLDLFITEVYDGRPTDVYTNDGHAVFTTARRMAGITTEGGWGSAVSDYDRDGDQDYLAYTLFRNDAATGHWLELRLVGDVASNRSAIGAIAWVTAGGVTTMRSVSGGNGTGCQDSQTLHFGLGSATAVDNVTVWFPGGGTVDFGAVEADSAWRLAESGSVEPL
jgi:hypothetical protein